MKGWNFSHIVRYAHATKRTPMNSGHKRQTHVWTVGGVEGEPTANRCKLFRQKRGFGANSSGDSLGSRIFLAICATPVAALASLWFTVRRPAFVGSWNLLSTKTTSGWKRDETLFHFSATDAAVTETSRPSSLLHTIQVCLHQLRLLYQVYYFGFLFRGWSYKVCPTTNIIPQETASARCILGTGQTWCWWLPTQPSSN